MEQHHKKILLLALFLIFATSTFMLGQIFYYSKQVGIATTNALIANNSNLTANLTAVLQQQKIILKYQEKGISVDPNEFKTWIESYSRAYTDKQELRINTSKILAYLGEISKEINNSPINARLVIDNGKASEFEPPQPGKLLNIPATAAVISAVLANGGYSNSADKTINIALVIDEKQPEVNLDKINDLGIKTLLARGESNFAISPRFRIHNITVGSKKFTGILIKPGDEFSFNQFLGPVDASTGYLPELVIKNKTVIPEYGGGLCQVTTTLFRAVALAGLPILERHAHSLPVHYYNPQGFDATIYPGISDFRFKNDTPAYILIQSKIIYNKLYFEIYGTNDNRKVALDGPRQYDIQSNGALKAVLIRIVTYPDATEKKDIFTSSYDAPGSFTVIKNPLE